MNALKFGFNQNAIGDEARQTLVQGLSALTKMSLNKEASNNNPLTIKYNVVAEDYAKLNDKIKEKILTYSKDQANLPEGINVLTKKGLTQAFTNSNFEWNFFAIQTEVLGALLADTEVADIMRFVNVSTVGLGDSKTYYLGSKALYEVEDTTYGNTTTRPRKHFKQPLTITPSPKECSVQFDVIQMITADFDFGAEMAKVIMSIRAHQYQAAVDIVYSSTPLAGTPFYKNTFNKDNYTELADRISAVNNTGVMSFGTRRAFSDASDTITTGFTVQDELVKKTYIADLFNVPSNIIPQSVNTNSASYDFRVPNDKLILMSNIEDKPVKMVQEDYVYVELEDGMKSSIQTRVYKYVFSYGIGLVTANVYGIQDV